MIPNLNLFSGRSIPTDPTSSPLNNGSAGVISGTLIDNRDMQFGLKLIF
jgi:hypothetical protein